MRIRPLLLSAIAVTVLLAGCSASTGPVESPDPERIETDAPAADGFSIAELVAQLPPITGPSLISVGDVAAAEELAGLERPAEPGDDLVQWVRATAGIESGATVSIPWPITLGQQQITQHAAYMDAVGFGVPQVDAFIDLSAPPTSFVLIDGDFDTSAVTAAIGEPEDEIWAQPGEELAVDPAGDRSVDRLGRPVFVAGDDARLVMSLQRGLARAHVDGITVDSPALADAAAVLDEEGAYAAMLWADGATVRGIALTEDGRTVAVVVDPDSTAPEVGATEATWTVTEVETRGAVTVIHLDVGDVPAGSTWNLLQMRSPLLGTR